MNDKRIQYVLSNSKPLLDDEIVLLNPSMQACQLNSDAARKKNFNRHDRLSIKVDKRLKLFRQGFQFDEIKELTDEFSIRQGNVQVLLMLYVFALALVGKACLACKMPGSNNVCPRRKFASYGIWVNQQTRSAPGISSLTVFCYDRAESF